MGRILDLMKTKRTKCQVDEAVKVEWIYI